MFVEGRLEYAHRVAWCIAHDFPDIRGIDHLTIIRTCDRNECVEREHLVAKPKKKSVAERIRSEKI
jgi:hypothetical protein